MQMQITKIFDDLEAAKVKALLSKIKELKALKDPPKGRCRIGAPATLIEMSFAEDITGYIHADPLLNYFVLPYKYSFSTKVRLKTLKCSLHGLVGPFENDRPKCEPYLELILQNLEELDTCVNPFPEKIELYWGLDETFVDWPSDFDDGKIGFGNSVIFTSELGLSLLFDDDKIRNDIIFQIVRIFRQVNDQFGYLPSLYRVSIKSLTEKRSKLIREYNP